MVADVDICNRVLQAIGTRSTIVSLTEQSPEAAACNTEYAATRDELLREYLWNFARYQAPLSVLKAAQGTPENPAGTIASPPQPWLYSYAQPTDCVRARYILPVVPQATVAGVPISPVQGPTQHMLHGPPVRFVQAADIDGNGGSIVVLLTNMRQAQLVYTRRIIEPGVWDALFQSALVGRLAAKLVIALSGDKALAKMAIQRGEEAEVNAAASNGNEGLVVMNSDAEWIQHRGGYFSGYDPEENY